MIMYGGIICLKYRVETILVFKIFLFEICIW
jgi:hypothetical protein